MRAPVAVWRFDALLDEPALQAVDLPGEQLSLDQISAALPGGAYTTFRTYQVLKALRLENHLQRLVQTARLAGVSLSICQPGLRSAIRQALALYHAGFFTGNLDEGLPARQDVRLRLTIDLERQPGQAYLAIEPLCTPSPDEYQNGVSAITVSMERQLPEAKLTRFIQRSQPVRQSLSSGVNEVLMVDHNGNITEGLSSNFFAILNGQVMTAGHGILAGVTRSVVLECIQQQGIPLVLAPLSKDRIPELEEAFITSSSRGLLPLCQIDQTRISDGFPGPLTHQVMVAFESAVANQLQPI
jgi:branched-chain amino acid aminotransferase